MALRSSWYTHVPLMAPPLPNQDPPADCTETFSTLELVKHDTAARSPELDLEANAPKEVYELENLPQVGPASASVHPYPFPNPHSSPFFDSSYTQGSPLTVYLKGRAPPRPHPLHRAHQPAGSIQPLRERTPPLSSKPPPHLCPPPPQSRLPISAHLRLKTFLLRKWKRIYFFILGGLCIIILVAVLIGVGLRFSKQPPKASLVASVS